MNDAVKFPVACWVYQGRRSTVISSLREHFATIHLTSRRWLLPAKRQARC
jgi:hypothetical protein